MTTETYLMLRDLTWAFCFAPPLAAFLVWRFRVRLVGVARWLERVLDWGMGTDE